MYFSGQMLDEYSKHVELLKPDAISDFVGDESDPADKARVNVAGIVTSVTLKNTRNGDRMAFFTLEDRMAEIECVAFARQYAENAHLIHTDAALYVSGSISLREDEPPKILINRLEALVEDTRFRPEEHSIAPQKKAFVPKTETRDADVQRSVPQNRSQTPPRRLFLRVPKEQSEHYFKALNLVELFEGDFPAYFYFADEKRYDTVPHGVLMSDYVLRELSVLLGEENVILK